MSQANKNKLLDSQDTHQETGSIAGLPYKFTLRETSEREEVSMPTSHQPTKQATINARRHITHSRTVCLLFPV
mgnify:CR=1